MKQNPTKCTVRLRKHDEKNSWYLYIEAYPVYVNGNPTPNVFVNTLTVLLPHPSSIRVQLPGLMGR